ncbi:MAG TPA: type II secretion system F family protein [Gemmatimonadales bacterium]|nr:type II secretion system F family protein [Gemmatimonadales bacterium]
MVKLSSTAWLFALAAFLVVALATVSVVLLWEWFRERQRKRMMVQQLRELADGVGQEQQRTLLRSAVSQAAWLGPVAARLPQLKDIEHMLQQAGLTWTLQTFFLLSAGLAVAVGVAVFAVTEFIPAALLGTIIGGALPYIYVSRKRARRLAQFEEVLPDSIDLMGRALRAGHPLSAGFKMAAEDGAEPVSGELRRVFEEQRFGLPLDESLLGLADRINLVDVRILVTAIMIQREVGGNLAEILDNLASVIRARFTIRRQLRVYTAQGRLTGYLLAALPIVLFSLLYTLNPEYMSILFKDPTGKIVTMIAVCLQLVGFLWIRKIINIEI